MLLALVLGRKDKGNISSVCFRIVAGGEDFHLFHSVYAPSMEMKGTNEFKHLFEIIIFVIQASLVVLQSKALLLFPITNTIRISLQPFLQLHLHVEEMSVSVIDCCGCF